MVIFGSIIYFPFLTPSLTEMFELLAKKLESTLMYYYIYKNNITYLYVGYKIHIKYGISIIKVMRIFW